MGLARGGRIRQAGKGRGGQVIRGLLSGAFWGLVTGALVLVVAAVVIENRRQAALPPQPPAAGVETLAAPLPAPPASAAGGSGGLASLRPAVAEPRVPVAVPAPRPDPVGPAEAAVALAPAPPPLAPAVALTLPRATAPAPEARPEPHRPAEPVAPKRLERPRLEMAKVAKAGPVVALPAPDPAAAAPAAIPAPQFVLLDEAGRAPGAAAADLPPVRIPPAPAPQPAWAAAAAVMPLDATLPGGLSSARPRIAFVVEGGGALSDPLPDWARSRAGIEPAVGAAEGTGATEASDTPEAERLRFADGAWRRTGQGAGPVLYPDRADPAGFLAARAAGVPAWLAYDRLTAATPDLARRLDAAAERARRDGGVAVLVAADPALLDAIGAWLAAQGADAPDPVALSALH